MKGSGGTTGYDAFTTPARTLEQYAKARDEQHTPAAVAELRQIVDRMVAPDETAGSGMSYPGARNTANEHRREHPDQSGRADRLLRPPLPARRTAFTSLRTSTVMMVDDDPLMLEVVQTYLEEAGYVSFITTSQPKEAMGLFVEHRPDILLLDLMMPEVSGFDILARGARSRGAALYTGDHPDRGERSVRPS